MAAIRSIGGRGSTARIVGAVAVAVAAVSVAAAARHRRSQLLAVSA